MQCDDCVSDQQSHEDTGNEENNHNLKRVYGLDEESRHLSENDIVEDVHGESEQIAISHKEETKIQLIYPPRLSDVLLFQILLHSRIQ